MKCAAENAKLNGCFEHTIRKIRQSDCLKMMCLIRLAFLLIPWTITIQASSLRSPFDSRESSYSSFLFPRSYVPRSSLKNSFVFPRSIFSRRLSVENGRNQLLNELIALNKTCPKGLQLVHDKNVGKSSCECKKYHLQWPEDGLCYKEYEQGPCPTGHR